MGCEIVKLSVLLGKPLRGDEKLMFINPIHNFLSMKGSSEVPAELNGLDHDQFQSINLKAIITRTKNRIIKCQQ